MFNTVWICVPSGVAQDFARTAGADREAPYQRVAAFLSAKLATCDPQSNTPRYEAPFFEQWVIDSTLMLG